MLSSHKNFSDEWTSSYAYQAIVQETREGENNREIWKTESSVVIIP